MEVNGYFTRQGLELAAKVAAGAALTITKVIAGSGTAADPAAASSLSEPRQTLAVNTPTHLGTTATLPVTLVATQASADYTLMELGVYARDPDKGEILYKIYKLTPPVAVTAGSRTVLRFYLEEIVTQDTVVTALCSPAGLLTEGSLHTALARLARTPAREVYVSKDGSDESGNGSKEYPYLTIQHAVDSLKGLLTVAKVYIGPGTYEENILLYDLFDITLQGTNQENIPKIQSITGQNCCSVGIWYVEIYGVQDESYRAAISLSHIGRAFLGYVKAVTEDTASSAYGGGLRFMYSPMAALQNCEISNKYLAISVVGGTVHLGSYVSGTGNTIALRAGDGYGQMPGIIFKGTSTLEGTEVTGYGGQIW